MWRAWCLFLVWILALAPSAWAEPRSEADPPLEKVATKPASGGLELIWERPPWRFDRLGETLARLFGGVELSRFAGEAGVSSGIVDESGETYQVASGAAARDGWGIALYWSPEASGFFVRPTLGFLSQSVEIADFRADLPLASVPNAREIPGVCYSIETGETISCDAPNTYGLHINTTYLGARGGLALVAAAKNLRLVSAISFGLNLLELRGVEAEVAEQRAEASSWSVVRSAGAELMVGAEWPKTHLALRFSVAYDRYFGIDPGVPLEFRGPVVYDEDIRQFRRPVVRVQDAGLEAWSYVIAGAFLF